MVEWKSDCKMISLDRMEKKKERDEEVNLSRLKLTDTAFSAKYIGLHESLEK